MIWLTAAAAVGIVSHLSIFATQLTINVMHTLLFLPVSVSNYRVKNVEIQINCSLVSFTNWLRMTIATLDVMNGRPPSLLCCICVYSLPSCFACLQCALTHLWHTFPLWFCLFCSSWKSFQICQCAQLKATTTTFSAALENPLQCREIPNPNSHSETCSACQ